MLRSNKNTFCSADGDNIVDAALSPPETKAAVAGGGGAQVVSCHSHLDPYYYVILGSL